MEWLGLAWLAFVALLIVLRLMARRMRRNLQKNDISASHDWQLADLRRLADNGQLSEEEYQRARDVILSRTDARFEPAKGFPVLGPVDQGKSKQHEGEGTS